MKKRANFIFKICKMSFDFIFTSFLFLHRFNLIKYESDKANVVIIVRINPDIIDEYKIYGILLYSTFSLAAKFFKSNLLIFFFIFKN